MTHLAVCKIYQDRVDISFINLGGKTVEDFLQWITGYIPTFTLDNLQSHYKDLLNNSLSIIDDNPDLIFNQLLMQLTSKAMYAGDVITINVIPVTMSDGLIPVRSVIDMDEIATSNDMSLYDSVREHVLSKSNVSEW